MLNGNEASFPAQVKGFNIYQSDFVRIELANDNWSGLYFTDFHVDMLIVLSL